jgi:hypothetical protein
MKVRYSGILLLLIWLIQGNIAMVVFQIERQQCRASSTSLIEKLNLGVHTKIIEINSFEDIQWEVEGKEFYWNTQLLDVIKIEKHDNKLIINCFADIKEQSLVFKFHKRHSDANKAGNESQKKLKGGLKYLNGQYLEDRFVSVELISTGNHQLNLYKTVWITINHPPPEV